MVYDWREVQAPELIANIIQLTFFIAVSKIKKIWKSVRSILLKMLPEKPLNTKYLRKTNPTLFWKVKNPSAFQTNRIQPRKFWNVKSFNCF